VRKSSGYPGLAKINFRTRIQITSEGLDSAFTKKQNPFREGEMRHLVEDQVSFIL